MKLIIVFSFLIGIYFYSAEACSCIPRHPQEHYCDADFVVVVKVIKKVVLEEEMRVVYTVKVLKKFKVNPEATVALQTKKIYTSSSSASCGVTLNIGHEYLLTGYVSSNQAHINLCGFNVQLQYLTDHQLKGFKFEYKKACSCKVVRCFTPEECSQTNSHECPMENDKIECYYNESTCKKDCKGRCKWTRCALFLQCLKP